MVNDATRARASGAVARARAWVTDVAGRISRHLIVVPFNNSGSTFLTAALRLPTEAIWLPAEGQAVPGFCGPRPADAGLQFVWGHKGSVFEQTLRDRRRYDWPRIRQSWYASARINSASAHVFVEKSPPNIARVDMLAEHFAPARFLFLVRDPYAVGESILRQRRELRGTIDLERAAAEHVCTLFRLQKENIRRFGPWSTLIRYEDLCMLPRAAAAQVSELVGAFEDLDFDRAIPVKGRYYESLRDMNEEHIGRLETAQLRTFNAVFEEHEDLFAEFGYGRRG